MKILRYMLVASTLCVSTYVASSTPISKQTMPDAACNNIRTVYACATYAPTPNILGESVGCNNGNPELSKSDVKELLANFNPYVVHAGFNRPVRYLTIYKSLMCIKTSSDILKHENTLIIYSMKNLPINNNVEAIDTLNHLDLHWNAMEAKGCPRGSLSDQSC